VGDLSCAGIVHQNVFYFEGRQQRRIYEDVELHSLILTLILSLLMTPKHGLLDSRYCDQYPIMRFQRNIPFLLSVHLNHGANKAVLPWVFQQVENIGWIGGLRLLKLLCESAMHRWMYTNMRIIGGGQFGTVFQSMVQLSDQSNLQVAIKQIPKQTNIKDRCVFFDVFSEIVCMDSVRFEDHVCHIYDYGVDESGYWIVLKWYNSTLKKWRDSLAGSMNDNLPVLLAVFKQILKAIRILHKKDIVHYDLKCDNIMIELNKPHGAPGASEDAPHSTEHEEPKSSSHDELVPRIALVDFGESRRFGASDELDLRNRGTELVKAPEMLDLDWVGRKDSKAFDRRKRVGTNKSADMWSVGCLFFELFTGRFLFQDYDFASHWACTTGKDGGDVLNEVNERRLGGKGPLVEFLRYLLAPSPERRPNIEAALKKFDAAAAEALRGTGREVASDPCTPRDSLGHRNSGFSTPDSPRSVAQSIGGSSAGAARSGKDSVRPDRPLVCAAAGYEESYFAQVLSNLCVLEVSDEELSGVDGLGSGAWGALKSRLGQHAWSHVIDFRLQGAGQLPFQLDVPHVMRLPWSSTSRGAEEFVYFLPAIFDFLRHAAILRG
ncbi:unnamed protein product, partial [Polarella glacialis]